MMKRLFAISACAFLGGSLRELITVTMNPLHNLWFTVAVNLLGAFLLSILVEGLPAWLPISETWATALGVGLIGSFTTFSTFSVTAWQLLNQQKFLLVGTYIGISLIGGLLAAELGNLVTQKILKRKARRW